MRIKALTAVVLWLSASGALCQSWTIGNDRIERMVTFDPVSGLVTQRLADLTTHTEFISAGKGHLRRPALEFSLACNGQTLDRFDVSTGEGRPEHDCQTESRSPFIYRARHFPWKYPSSTGFMMAIRQYANGWY